MRLIKSCHAPLSPVDLIRVLADLVPAREPTRWTHTWRSMKMQDAYTTMCRFRWWYVRWRYKVGPTGYQEVHLPSYILGEAKSNMLAIEKDIPVLLYHPSLPPVSKNFPPPDVPADAVPAFKSSRFHWQCCSQHSVSLGANIIWRATKLVTVRYHCAATHIAEIQHLVYILSGKRLERVKGGFECGMITSFAIGRFGLGLDNSLLHANNW